MISNKFNSFIEGVGDVLKILFQLKGLGNMQKLIAIVALTAIIASVFVCDIAKAQNQGESYAVSGILVNNGKPFGVFGYAYRASPSLSYFVQSEMGGDDQAFGAAPILTFRISDRLTVGALIGPQVEIIQENPDFEEAVSYLGATTGIIGIYEISDRTGLWLGIRYLMIDADLKPFKIGIGLILKL